MTVQIALTSRYSYAIRSKKCLVKKNYHTLRRWMTRTIASVCVGVPSPLPPVVTLLGSYPVSGRALVLFIPSPSRGEPREPERLQALWHHAVHHPGHLVEARTWTEIEEKKRVKSILIIPWTQRTARKNVSMQQFNCVKNGCFITNSKATVYFGQQPSKEFWLLLFACTKK